MVATRGRAKFPTVITLFTFFLVTKLTLFAGASYEYMEDTTGIVIVCVVALALAYLVGFLVRRSIWTQICLAGIYTGFSVGGITFAIAMKAHGSGAIESNIFFLWSAIFALVGGILCSTFAISLGFAKKVVLYGTSLFGSYVFGHGWALLFGGLPDEMEMYPRL